MDGSVLVIVMAVLAAFVLHRSGYMDTLSPLVRARLDVVMGLIGIGFFLVILLLPPLSQ